MRKAIFGIFVALVFVNGLAAPLSEKADAEEQAWLAVKASGLAQAYEAYLIEYPKGRYASPARVKLAILADQEANKAAHKSRVGATPGAVAPFNWGVSDLDLSVRPAADLLKKAGLPDRQQEVLNAAEAGDRIAQYLAGASYELGVGVAKDPGMKAAWLKKAADQGVIRARAAFALAQIMGAGVPEDAVSGWALLLECVHAGNAIAQYNAAILILQGVKKGNGGVVQFSYLDRPTAFGMLRRSAEAGMPYSQYSLGLAYMVGTAESGGKDAGEARYWLEKAAAQNVAQASADLARLGGAR